MTLRVALVSSVYDAYDPLKPFPEQEGVDVDAVCVTDDPELACEGWRVVVEPREGIHPNRAAKVPKMLPWRYTDAVCSVWVDASFEIVSPTFVSDVLAYAYPIAQFVHPWRSDVFDEAEECLALQRAGQMKYVGQPITEQMEHVRSTGFPPGWGLWATGVIARWHWQAVRDFGHEWLDACNRWTFQDQLSEAPALRAHGLRPVALPGTHLANEWLICKPSARHA